MQSNKNRLKTILLINMLFFCVFSSPLNAQNQVSLEDIDSPEQTEELSKTEEDDLFTEDRPAEITDTANLRAEFVQKTQNPSSKVVRFEMILTTNVTSDRIKVTWEIDGASEAINEEQLETVITGEAGETYTFPLDIIPNGQGISEIQGKAELFEADARSLAFVRKNYASNASSEILPLTSEYENARLASNISSGVFYTVLVALTIGGVYFGSKRFVRWYKTDERDTYKSI